MAAHVVGARSRIRIGPASANLIALGSHAELKSLILPNRVPYPAYPYYYAGYGDYPRYVYPRYGYGQRYYWGSGRYVRPAYYGGWHGHGWHGGRGDSHR